MIWSSGESRAFRNTPHKVKKAKYKHGNQKDYAITDTDPRYGTLPSPYDISDDEDAPAPAVSRTAVDVPVAPVAPINGGGCKDVDVDSGANSDANSGAEEASDDDGEEEED
ncbi:uncharacterized protein LAJ45_05317 [Morchella importuna]|uniref:uncharacterized protein n=1 Tax=Morchella importuna TaxID=1174673 RepID=UPI001E8DC220|nr:uncharacterized protein LAJ45_05317 [Morchella importuna]KAH8150621.1 hypothetical protein LAJ45_05317 [Morchella importuna]